MGAFIIFDIEFTKNKDRERFEKLYKIKKNEIIVDENSKCFGAAWLMFRNPTIQVIYNMGFMGYGEPFEKLEDSISDYVLNYLEKPNPYL